MINKLITTIYAQVPLLYKTQETKSRWEVERIVHKGWTTLRVSTAIMAVHRPTLFSRTIISLLNRKALKNDGEYSSVYILIQSAGSTKSIHYS
jgi:hypothetical protein